MKKNISIVVLTIVLIAPFSASASIFDDFYGVIKDLQKQVVNLISTTIDIPKPAQLKIEEGEIWQTFTSSTLGFEIQYPRDFTPSNIFSVAPDYKNTEGFVRVSREDFLKKIVKPDSTSFDLVLQDSAIFFRSGDSDDMYLNPDKYLGKISTSTKQIGSTTVDYILYSGKTDQTKFGGGSMEKIIFTSGSTTIIAETNFSSDTPSGPTKVIFDKMLTTFKFISSSSSPEIIPMSSSTLISTTTEQDLITATSTPEQVLGNQLSL